MRFQVLSPFKHRTFSIQVERLRRKSAQTCGEEKAEGIIPSGTATILLRPKTGTAVHGVRGFCRGEAHASVSVPHILWECSVVNIITGHVHDFKTRYDDIHALQLPISTF
jgi:hypothetical protein